MLDLIMMIEIILNKSLGLIKNKATSSCKYLFFLKKIKIIYYIYIAIC